MPALTVSTTVIGHAYHPNNSMRHLDFNISRILSIVSMNASSSSTYSSSFNALTNSDKIAGLFFHPFFISRSVKTPLQAHRRSSTGSMGEGEGAERRHAVSEERGKTKNEAVESGRGLK